MSKRANNQPFDIANVQMEIERTLMEKSPIEYAQPHIRNATAPPIIEYPTYLPETENVSAVTVASQYEEAAKEIEAMGEALKLVAQRAEAMAAQASEALKFVSETAAYYRTEASSIFEEIEKVDTLSNAVITACTDMRDRIKKE